MDTDGIDGIILAFAPGIAFTIANLIIQKKLYVTKKDSGTDVENGEHSNDTMNDDEAGEGLRG